ncbi:MAG: glutaredoxin family protein [Chloroflexi bacterium]|nr:glutaredoxin family protein [Chloroflexota bacterium]
MSGDGPPHRVVLYSRPGCHLCHQVRDILERLQTEFLLTLQEVDIAGDQALLARYGEAIPVVVVDGRVTLTAPISEFLLRRALTQGAGKRARG